MPLTINTYNPAFADKNEGQARELSLEHPQRMLITVTSLAQCAHWVVADMQAFCYLSIVSITECASDIFELLRYA